MSGGVGRVRSDWVECAREGGFWMMAMMTMMSVQIKPSRRHATSV